MRVLLDNYISDSETPADINDLNTDGISSSRHMVEKALELNSTEVDQEVIDFYRPAIFQKLSDQTDKDFLVYKTHEKYYLNSDNEPIFPTSASKAVIYLVRDPRDVAVSYAAHLGRNISETISFMNKEISKCDLRAPIFDTQLTEDRSSWSGHYLSWLGQMKIPFQLVRYEDMLIDTQAELKKVCEFIGLEWIPERAQIAIQFSSFSKLREQEEERGFKERSPKHEQFFRKGISGDWRNALTDDDVASIIDCHGPVMRALGYL